MIVQHYSPTGEPISFKEAKRIRPENYAIMTADLGGGEMMMLLRESMVTTMQPDHKFCIRQLKENKSGSWSTKMAGTLLTENFATYSTAYDRFQYLYKEACALRPDPEQRIVINTELDLACLIEQGTTKTGVMQPENAFDNKDVAQMTQEEELLEILNSQGYEALF